MRAIRAWAHASQRQALWNARQAADVMSAIRLERDGVLAFLEEFCASDGAA